MSILHPRRNDDGGPVTIRKPHTASALSAWEDVHEVATAVPGKAISPRIGDVAVQSWIDAPHNAAGWERLATTPVFDEPGFAAHGLKAASGAVVVEPDGRVWTVSPTNAFGGYTNTFPKGSLDAGHQLSLKANAIKEVFEESGLRVELLGFLVDTKRTTSTTRYYVARRVAGTPADMGWESQAVHLVPAKTLSHFASHPNDKPIIAALLQWIAQHPWQADR